MSADTRHSEIVAAYCELQHAARDAESWVHSPVGADLWVDGIDAIRATDEPTFNSYLNLFEQYAAGATTDTGGHAGLDEMFLTDALEVFDEFVFTCARNNERSFWHALCLGFSLLAAFGGPPRVIGDHDRKLVINNDSLLILLSPDYRAIRFTAFNEGVQPVFVTSPGADLFRPEFGYFALREPYVIAEEPPRISQANVHHDLVHIVLFGDCYVRTWGTEAMTASLLLNAEETCVGVELMAYRDLARFGVALNHMDEITRLEGRVAAAASVDASARTRYQAGLKRAAQEKLGVDSPVARSIIDRAEVPADLFEWISEKSLGVHARYAAGLARGIHDPLFQVFAALLPPNSRHAKNLLHFVHHEWAETEPLLESRRAPEASLELRRRSRQSQTLRMLLIRGAEITVTAARDQAANAFIDEMLAWGMQVSEIYGLAEHGADVAEQIKLLTEKGQQLVLRHGGMDLPISSLSDPVTAARVST